MRFILVDPTGYANRDIKNVNLKLSHNDIENGEIYSLNRAVGGADEVAENGDVGTIRPDAAGIHGQAKPFGLFQVDTSIIEFRKAKTLRGQYAIQARRIYGARRAMAAPRTTSYLVELVPIVFLPSRHTLLLLQLCPCNFDSLWRPQL